MTTTLSRTELISRDDFDRLLTPRCASCQSENQGTFTSEIALQFAGIEGLNKPMVWMFPTVSVCLDCGKAHFIVPARELKVLRTGAPVEDAAVWLGSSEE